MTTTTRKLQADIVFAYLECAYPVDQTEREIGNAVSMKKGAVKDAIRLLMTYARIEYGEYREGVGLTYRVAAVRER